MESLSKLGIDLWSLLLYAINFGVIVAVIAVLFSKPILEIMDKRRRLIKGNIDEAEKLKNELAKQKEKMDQEKEELKIQLAEEMDKMRQELDNKRREADKEIDAKKSKMLEEIRAVMDEEKKSLQANVQKEVLELVQKIVMHIVTNKVSEDIISQSAKESWENFKRK